MGGVPVFSDENFLEIFKLDQLVDKGENRA